MGTASRRHAEAQGLIYLAAEVGQRRSSPSRLAASTTVIASTPPGAGPAPLPFRPWRPDALLGSAHGLIAIATDASPVVLEPLHRCLTVSSAASCTCWITAARSLEWGFAITLPGPSSSVVVWRTLAWAKAGQPVAGGCESR